MDDRQYAVHEVEAVIRIKFMVGVDNDHSKKQLDKYPVAILEDLTEELGYRRVELVSSDITLIKGDLTFGEASRLCNSEEIDGCRCHSVRSHGRD